MNSENQELIDVREGENFNHLLLYKYLSKKIEIKENDLQVLQFGGGHANLTYLLKFGNNEFVLRRPPLGPIAPSSHDMFREHTVQSALNKVFPLAPDSLFFCDDESIIGAKFHIMERRKGIVIRKAINNNFNFSKENIRKISFNMIDIISTLHNIDPSKIGLGSLGRPDGFVLRQLDGWEDRWRKSSHNKSTESRFDALLNHLRKTLPKPQATTILHNDFKLDNIMWNEKKKYVPEAVFDWDMCTRGDPLMDIGHMLNYWIDENDDDESKLITSMPYKNVIYPSRKEMINYYAKKTDFDMKDIHWYYAFGAFKLAVIIQQIYIRFLKGQTNDQRFSNFGIRVEALINRANKVYKI
jgi:aminoglycoside phosphotransferase (APT) family kinase protein